MNELYKLFDDIEFHIIIDKFNEHDFMKIRLNIDKIYIPNNI